MLPGQAGSGPQEMGTYSREATAWCWTMAGWHTGLYTLASVFLPLPFLLCNQGQPAPLMDKCAPRGILRSLLCRHCQTCSLQDGRRKWGLLAPPALFPHSRTPWRVLQVCIWKVAKWLLLQACHATLTASGWFVSEGLAAAASHPSRACLWFSR